MEQVSETAETTAEAGSCTGDGLRMRGSGGSRPRVQSDRSRDRFVSESIDVGRMIR